MAMFDAGRFLRLARAHWSERGRRYLWFLGIGIVVHGCVWLLVTRGASAPQHYDSDMQSVLFHVGFLLTALLFAGLEFASLARRGAALTWLMRPASALEKFLLAFLLVAVLYPVAYTLAFQVCNLPGSWLGQLAAEHLAAVDPKFKLDARSHAPWLPFVAPEDRAAEFGFLLLVNGLQALIVAGALRFRKLASLKTAVALFVLLFIVVPLLAMFSRGDVAMLYPGTWLAGDDGVFLAWRWAFWIGVPVLFWASAFCYLRDRELH